MRLPVAQVGYTLAHAGAEVVLCHRDFLPLLDALRPSLPRLRTVVLIADGEEAPAPSYASSE